MKKYFLTAAAAVILLGGLFILDYYKYYDDKLHIIFCDVGQGDAILIKTPNMAYILVDGGPDRSVLSCLSRHMPFWNRNIDLMMLTHPHADHFFGMFDILAGYHVNLFATEELRNKTQSYAQLLLQFENDGINQIRLLAGDKWRSGKVSIIILGPDQEYLDQTSPGGTIGESKEFASVITHVAYGSFDVLLTGDSQAQGLKLATDRLDGNIEILQSPHHGSSTGLNETLLDEINPKLAIISVGANNHYGHPSEPILQLYNMKKIPYLRTDKSGDVEIVSDGHIWWVKK